MLFQQVSALGLIDSQVATLSSAGVPLAQLDRRSKPDVADFTPGLSAQPGSGDLDLKLVARGPKHQLKWTQSIGTEATTTQFGKNGDSALACYADNDNIADQAVINYKRFVVLRSTDATQVTIPLNIMGTVKASECQDINGDGIDELVLYHSAHYDPVSKMWVRKGFGGVSIFSLTTTGLLKTTTLGLRQRGMVVLDVDGDGLLDTCTYQNKGKAAILTCNITNGETQTISVPFTIYSASGGTYATDDSGKPVDGIAVITRPKKDLSVLRPDGKVAFKGLRTDIGQVIGSLKPRSGYNFARCR